MFDPEIYRQAVFKEVKQWRERRPNESIKDAAANLALSTNCPKLVICKFLLELEGESEELETMIQRLQDFYK